MPERPRGLPNEPAYWESLARRVEDAAVRRAGALPWIAGHASVVGVLALAASLVVVIATGRTGGGAADPGTNAWIATFAPSDPLGRSLNAAEPPRLGRLVLGDR